VVRFDNAPPGILAGISGLDYCSHKQHSSMNCQVIANDRKIICDRDCDQHDSAHNACMLRGSTAKQFLEQQRKYVMAGDSAYPISLVLLKPYAKQEGAANSFKRLFNCRLCGLKTAMSENVYSVWKQLLPCLRHMQAHAPC
jgi:hypothetical protein